MPTVSMRRILKISPKQQTQPKLNIKKKYVKEIIYENNNEWTDGEVPWEPLEEDKESYPVVIRPTTLENNVGIVESSTRDKIWLFLEETHWKARFSGALKCVQLGSGDTIINELENFDSCDACNLSYDNVGISFANKARNANNYNTELEFLFTMATVISYQFYKKMEQEDLRNEKDLGEYFRIRRQTFILALCIMLIFMKNIKNAV